MLEHTDNDELKEILKKNSELLKENNTLLKKLHRNAVVGIVLRVVWYAVLIGLPFALYFYLLEPYFDAFGSSYEVFKTGLNELPGLKGIEQLFDSVKGE